MSDRPLVIVHVDPERGFAGGEAQVLGLVRQLAALGARQTVAADPRGPLASAVAALGVAVAPLRIRNHLDVVAGRRLHGLLAREACDIVHFHTARAHAMTAFLGRRRVVRRVVTRRMDYPLRGGWYARWLYNVGVDAVVAISEGVRRVLIESGVAPGRIHVVPSGVDLDRFRDADARRAAERACLGVAEQVTLAAVVGALEERKGHAVLLDAVARLGDLPLVVCCAGGGSLGAALAARATALGLGDRVRFLGPLDDPAGLLAAADLLVMPSRHEGLGVAALEAMAAGRPVIAARVGGLAEAVDDGTTGLLVPPDDPAALAAALRRAVEEPTLRQAWGAAGRARAAERFSGAATAHGTLAVYRRLVEGSHGGPGATA